MSKRVSELNEKCNACIGKIKFLKHKLKLHSPSLHNKPLSKVYIDTISLSRSRMGMKYLLTMEDGFSRFLMAIPVPDNQAQTLARAILEKFSQSWGSLSGSIQIMEGSLPIKSGCDYVRL